MERARACLLLADRFTTDPEQEDLSILFQARRWGTLPLPYHTAAALVQPASSLPAPCCKLPPTKMAPSPLLALQVWAVKSYTKTVPLYVQTIRQSTVRRIAPFLDPGQDVVVSKEETRLR